MSGATSSRSVISQSIHWRSIGHVDTLRTSAHLYRAASIFLKDEHRRRCIGRFSRLRNETFPPSCTLTSVSVRNSLCAKPAHHPMGRAQRDKGFFLVLAVIVAGVSFFCSRLGGGVVGVPPPLRRRTV